MDQTLGPGCQHKIDHSRYCGIGPREAFRGRRLAGVE
jgi:hypothetical protein